MSYEHQFYLKKNAAKVQKLTYEGDDIFYISSQRSLSSYFRGFGTKVDDNTVEMNLVQAVGMLADLSEQFSQATVWADAFITGMGVVLDGEFSADRMMLDTYAVARSAYNKHMDSQPYFLCELNTDEPMRLFATYLRKLARMVASMSEDDILVFHESY